jgi:hypothetical protein
MQVSLDFKSNMTAVTAALVEHDLSSLMLAESRAPLIPMTA